nr:MAG TPA: hypothetical protein [Caudoviricetes sp.]
MKGHKPAFCDYYLVCMVINYYKSGINPLL